MMRLRRDDQMQSQKLSGRVLVRSSSTLEPKPARRPGFRERRLVGPAQSRDQHVILVDVDVGAEAEVHPVSTSESLFVIKGLFEVALDACTERVASGDLCHFPAGTSHGLKCLAGPGQLLLIWAPPLD
jgi:quercetin dioxygenase-like cupin family protein